jgi:tetratricopeptide (TPR) repeat protein
MPFLTPVRALEERSRGEELAAAGQMADACFSLAWAMESLRAHGLEADEAQAALFLAWAQVLDGRSWQAARTLRGVLNRPGFALASQRHRSWGHLLYAWALWDMGEYARSREQAELAYVTSDQPADRGRASLTLGQVLLHLGETKLAGQSFSEAVRLDPSLRVGAFSVRAYFHNLTGRHRAALSEAEAGLAETHYKILESYDITSRAVERSALMVEQGTAKAFLGHSDAWKTLTEAQALLDSLPFDTQIESARVRRAMGLVLTKAGERHAALALLEEALKVFRRKSVRPEYELTVRALNRVHKKGRGRVNDKAPA